MRPDRKVTHILFVFVIVLLTIFKWHDFYLPYFWDELGVYSRAINFQVIHGVSLMPASLPPDLSRGHPLLFTCANAMVAKIFGGQVFVIHIFCFFISTLLLLAVYLKISKYFNPVTAIVSVVVLAIQPLFLAQSCLVLPEITLAFFVFMAVCSYYEDRFLLFALFASLAILTKEAAIVLPLTVLGYSAIKWWLLKIKPQGFNTGAVSLTIVPYLVFGLFLIIQKHQNGWYFFPLHIGSVKFSFYTFFQQVQRFNTFIFRLQGRTVLTVLLITGSIFALIKGKWSCLRTGNSFLLLLLFLTVAFLVFNSLIDLYMERYGVVLLISFAICVSAALTSISENKFFVAAVILLLTGVSWQHMEDNVFHYDADLGYRREVNVLQQSVDYIAEAQKPGEQAISNFPGGFALYPEGGYLNGRRIDYRMQNNDSAPYYLLMCDPGSPFQVDTSNSVVTLLKEFNDGYAHSRIYFIKRK